MLRIVAFICIVILFSSCDKNWRRLHIEKRVYRDGYYVHVPWERHTPVNAYPKPQPYPVDHSRTAQTDTTQKNAGGIPAAGNQTTSNQSGSPPPDSPTGNGNSGTGGNGGGGSNPNVGYGGTPQMQTANTQPAPPLQPLPLEPEPPLKRPQRVAAPTVAPVDSVVVKTDTTKPKPDRRFEFPEGEVTLVAEAGLYNINATSGIEITPFSINAGLGMRYTIHPRSRYKIAGEAGFFQSTVSIAQNQKKVNPLLAETWKKERITQWKLRLLLTDKIALSGKEDAKAEAIELGIFSELGLFSTHVGINPEWMNDKAVYTRTKSRLFGLRYLNSLQYGLTARIVHGTWSAFANYRFSKMVKASPDGGDLPKLMLGAAFTFGE